MSLSNEARQEIGEMIEDLLLGRGASTHPHGIEGAIDAINNVVARCGGITEDLKNIIQMGYMGDEWWEQGDAKQQGEKDYGIVNEIYYLMVKFNSCENFKYSYKEKEFITDLHDRLEANGHKELTPKQRKWVLSIASRTRKIVKELEGAKDVSFESSTDDFLFGGG